MHFFCLSIFNKKVLAAPQPFFISLKNSKPLLMPTIYMISISGCSHMMSANNQGIQTPSPHCKPESEPSFPPCNTKSKICSIKNNFVFITLFNTNDGKQLREAEKGDRRSILWKGEVTTCDLQFFRGIKMSWMRLSLFISLTNIYSL